MAYPKSNNFNKDTIEDRLYRLMRMQNNIDAVELGVSGALLSWAQGCYDRFSGANTASATGNITLGPHGLKMMIAIFP